MWSYSDIECTFRWILAYRMFGDGKHNHSKVHIHRDLHWYCGSCAHTYMWCLLLLPFTLTHDHDSDRLPFLQTERKNRSCNCGTEGILAQKFVKIQNKIQQRKIIETHHRPTKPCFVVTSFSLLIAQIDDTCTQHLTYCMSVHVWNSPVYARRNETYGICHEIQLGNCLMLSLFCFTHSGQQVYHSFEFIYFFCVRLFLYAFYLNTPIVLLLQITVNVRDMKFRTFSPWNFKHFRCIFLFSTFFLVFLFHQFDGVLHNTHSSVLAAKQSVPLAQV